MTVMTFRTAGKPSTQLDKEHAIAVRKPDAPMHYYPAQHNHLVTERSIFGFKSALRLKWRHQDAKDETEQRDPCAPTLGDSLPQSIRIGFSVHTADQCPLSEVKRTSKMQQFKAARYPASPK